jgi:hypothetical protein
MFVSGRCREDDATKAASKIRRALQGANAAVQNDFMSNPADVFACVDDLRYSRFSFGLIPKELATVAEHGEAREVQMA